MIDLIQSGVLAGHHVMLQASTPIPTTLGTSPTSMSGAVSALNGDVTDVTTVASPTLAGLGATYAGYHAVAKAHAVRTGNDQTVHTHDQGIKTGIYAGVLAGGASGIIAILMHIL